MGSIVDAETFEGHFKVIRGHPLLLLLLLNGIYMAPFQKSYKAPNIRTKQHIKTSIISEIESMLMRIEVCFELCFETVDVRCISDCVWKPVP